MIGAYLPQESHAKEFDIKLNKAKKDKVKTTEEYLYLARWALKYGMIGKFHAAMKEATEVNRKDPTVLDYLRVQKELQGPFKEVDPAQAEVIEELRASGYKPSQSGFVLLVGVLLFNFVGFELPSSAGEEMKNPQRDVPFGIARSTVASVVLSCWRRTSSCSSDCTRWPACHAIHNAAAPNTTANSDSHQTAPPPPSAI